MTRTINLLSPEALERLQAGPEGTDVAGEMDPEPLPGVAGWEGAPWCVCGDTSDAHNEDGDCRFCDCKRFKPLSATVDCGDCGHRVAFGKCCPHCAHGCSMPGYPECPANEEK